LSVKILSPIIAPSLGVVTPAVPATDTTPAVPAVMGPTLEFAYTDAAGVERQARVPAAVVATLTTMADLQAWANATLDPAVPTWVVQPTG